MNGSTPVDVSVIIVSYNVRLFTEQCLRSVFGAQGSLALEVFVVDNGSTDGSVEYLRTRFPKVHFITNRENVGFGKANNQALKVARGRYFFILNPDTLLSRDTLAELTRYMDEHPAVGACGPKILTREGGFDPASKRGLPTAWTSFCKLSGLAALLPNSRLFGRYHLLYLDEDQPAEVDALAGSAMFVRREAYQATGGFDEDFFMYGEDIDLSYRIKSSGWQVHYAPVTRIVHFKGESTRRSPIDRDREFYGAMHLFVDKHFRGRYPWATHKLIDLGIILARLAARMKRVGGAALWPVIDFLLLWGLLALGRWLRWGAFGLAFKPALAITLQSLTWVLCLAGFGAYGHRRGRELPVALGMTLGFLINSSFVYFVRQFAYSRFLNLFGFVVGGALALGWRRLLKGLRKSALYQRFYRRRALIVGVGNVAQVLAARLTRSDALYQPVGFIDPQAACVGTLIANLPVLGGDEDLPRLVVQEEVEEVLFALDELDYNRILESVHNIGRTGRVYFKVIAPESAGDIKRLEEELSMEYLTPRRLGGVLRKMTSLAAGR